MNSLLAGLGVIALALVLSLPSEAASLRVAPVILDLRAPTAASSIRVWNDAERSINVQIRIFRWTQSEGEDRFEQTTDVVASPPITTLKPGGENLIRVVRTSKTPVAGEESYRLVVDELPDPSRRKDGTVMLVVRHSIPVFFETAEAAGPIPSWTVKPRSDGYAVIVENSGDQRLRVSNLALGDGRASVAEQNGLVGYVLAHSVAAWFVPRTGRGDLTGSSVPITADSEAGRFDATARLQGG